eukprot:NODE_7080_length_474_cov_17.148235_g6265_i0.p1 GENE.NODE_7080_length_474_cov_17.148235_g6265_i0~~NODE_7080_length_474_cov_17.148235_g6265_i0.p1  ORF type:complete len:85 (+),score=26.11 NODE_7080_length_474_cov_17.148235_g6265_i0:41-295(+)
MYSAVSTQRTWGANVTDMLKGHTEAVLATWLDLFDHLLLKYADGYVTTPQNVGTPGAYPLKWLKEAGYEEGPRPCRRTPEHDDC